MSALSSTAATWHAIDSTITASGLRMYWLVSCRMAAFARGKDLFASVGADGSVRMFDLRSLVHSTIIYEVSLILVTDGLVVDPVQVQSIWGGGGLGEKRCSRSSPKKNGLRH